MTNWLATHPRIAAWIMFPLIPFLVVIVVLLELKEDWRWVSSALRDFRKDGVETIKNASKQLVRFYKNYPEVLIENLNQATKDDAGAVDPPQGIWENTND